MLPIRSGFGQRAERGRPLFVQPRAQAEMILTAAVIVQLVARAIVPFENDSPRKPSAPDGKVSAVGVLDARRAIQTREKLPPNFVDCRAIAPPPELLFEPQTLV